MNDALEADARIVAKEARLRVGRPIDERMEAQVPRDLAAVGKHGIEDGAVGNVEPLVGVDVEDPVAARLLQRVVARGGEVVAPGEVSELDRKLLRLRDRVVARSGVDHNDLVDVADERLQTPFDETGFVPDDECSGQMHSTPPRVAVHGSAVRQAGGQDARTSARVISMPSAP